MERGSDNVIGIENDYITLKEWGYVLASFKFPLFLGLPQDWFWCQIQFAYRWYLL